MDHVILEGILIVVCGVIAGVIAKWLLHSLTERDNEQRAEHAQDGKCELGDVAMTENSDARNAENP